MASNDNDSGRATICGTFAAMPLAAVLAQAAERKATGVLSLLVPGEGQRGDIVLVGGQIASVNAVDAAREAGFLGAILYERGIIDAATFDRTLLDVARTKRLHGEVLVAEGAITREELDDALAEQTFRRLDALFAWPSMTVFALRDRDVRGDDPPRDAGRPAVEAGRAIWRGTRAKAPAEHVEAAIARMDGELHLTDAGTAARLGLDDDEKAFCVKLAEGGLDVKAALATRILPEKRARALLWCLSIVGALVSKAPRVIGPADLGVDGMRNRAETIVDEDPWAILGVARDASMEAVRAAYFRLARVWHPDKLPKSLGEARDAGSKIFSVISDAHRAIQDLHATRSQRGGPKAAPLTLRDADEALARGDRSRAVEIAAQLSRGGVHGPEARAILAWCDAEMNKNLERAIFSLDRVLAGDPDCVRALYYRAKLYERAGRSGAALADLRRVTRLDPRHRDAQRELRAVATRAARGGSSTKVKVVEEVVMPFQGRVASR